MTKIKNYLDSRIKGHNAKGRIIYEYLVECPTCSEQRWIQAPREHNTCVECGKKARHDARNYGDGYITKQGYHLVYDGTKYVPAHRIPFPDISADDVVHHIDGNKLHNEKSNLIHMTKADHRKCHGQLEEVSYSLIQAGLIEFDRESCTYSLSSSMEKFIELIPVNSGEPQTDGAVGNPEPSHESGRCNDYPIGEYIASAMEAQDTVTEDDGDDIVSSA
ncbi:HNH endonuclease [Vibrio phage vB_VspP_pVa5]|uniref:HNH endonuclease protein n=1 Tax=Vibrio phage vB_VspP_pVa5 TaxID=1913109 RepID=A0A1J0GV50_9CAUD|nr:HNH endonuclease [Vibrio phage vB_VspP_pVa5]APC46052.1 HNH endonuclease protein [Vibrio phage vB_VspP_pVa5]